MSLVAEFAAGIVAQAQAGRDLDFGALREQFLALARSVQGEAEHAALVQLFHDIMDMVEKRGIVPPEKMATFRQVRDQDYRLMLMPEITIGAHVSAELAAAVTAREVRAGRMRQDDPMRQSAEAALSQPFQSIAELQMIERNRKAGETLAKDWQKWMGRA